MEIRNFCILAHIDHGKSTLADRFLELTGAVEKRKMREQYLDMHPLERERGITIKMQPVRMVWHPPNHTSYQVPVANNQSDSAQDFVLNLIDTPGHVDFSYEVSRALAAVEGAILLVDATQGIQAQTIANMRLAQEEGLVIIPAINKIDLSNADVQRTEDELRELLGLSSRGGASDTIFKISAKTGEGIEELLRAVVEKIPPPRANNQLPVTSNQLLRALIFDSKYEPYLGVVAHVRMVDGVLKKGDRIFFMASGVGAEALEVGVFVPGRAAREQLSAGEIGYIATGIKEPSRVRVGDTITHADAFKHFSPKANSPPAENIETFKSFALPGYRDPSPMVWASLYPRDQDEYEALREALKKLQLEDAALVFVPEAAGVLGRGFRAGFLGMLHMEITAERIKREYALAVIFSRPSVLFRVSARTSSGGSEKVMAYAAHQLPPAHLVERIEEPWVALAILAPAKFLGALSAFVHERHSRITATVSRGRDRIQISCETPLREIVVDFYDILKSMTHGYASLSYVPIGWRVADLVRLDISVAGEIAGALSEIVPRSDAYAIACTRVEKLKEILPARLFAISLQASVDGRIIARETIPALKKDVTAHMYGGDRTRKMKLWKKQQRGKKRLQESARVDIPPEVFFKILSR